jgi:hypothetical protein
LLSFFLYFSFFLLFFFFLRFIVQPLSLFSFSLSILSLSTFSFRTYWHSHRPKAPRRTQVQAPPRTTQVVLQEMRCLSHSLCLGPILRLLTFVCSSLRSRFALTVATLVITKAINVSSCKMPSMLERRHSRFFFCLLIFLLSEASRFILFLFVCLSPLSVDPPRFTGRRAWTSPIGSSDFDQHSGRTEVQP